MTNTKIKNKKRGDGKYQLTRDNITYVARKKTINDIKFRLEYISNTFYNETFIMSEVSEHLRKKHNIVEDTSITKVSKLCNFLTNSGVWVLKNPTMEDIFEYYFTYREHKKRSEEKRQDEFLTEKNIETQQNIDDDWLINKIEGVLRTPLPRESKVNICIEYLHGYVKDGLVLDSEFNR
jgi:hypothetical protein